MKTIIYRIRKKQKVTGTDLLKTAGLLIGLFFALIGIILLIGSQL